MQVAGASHEHTVPGYRAVVREDRDEVISVVSGSYELLSNQRALELGKAAFHHLFPSTNPEQFRVYDIKLTRTGGACSIDLVDPAWRTDIWKQETWLPFLRVSNSYNRTRALSFDFGFVRELCTNGIIFDKKTIRAKYTHTKGQLKFDFEKDSAFQNLKAMEAEFTGQLRYLHSTPVHESLIAPLALQLLGIRFKLNSKDPKRTARENKRLDQVREALVGLLPKYTSPDEANAYSALNIATDFASHSPRLAGNFATAQALQTRIGQQARSLEAALVNGQALEEMLREQRTWFN